MDREYEGAIALVVISHANANLISLAREAYLRMSEMPDKATLLSSCTASSSNGSSRPPLDTTRISGELFVLSHSNPGLRPSLEFLERDLPTCHHLPRQNHNSPQS